MTWLQRACSANGEPSSARLITVMAGTTLSFCTALLSIGAFWRTEFVQVLPVFGTALAGLAGANYVAQQMSGKKNEPV